MYNFKPTRITVYSIHLTLFGLFILKLMATGLFFKTDDAKPPSSTATWLERMSESTCCELRLCKYINAVKIASCACEMEVRKVSSVVRESNCTHTEIHSYCGVGKC